MRPRLLSALALLAAFATPVLCQYGLGGTSLRDHWSRSSAYAGSGPAALCDANSPDAMVLDDITGVAVCRDAGCLSEQPLVLSKQLSKLTLEQAVHSLSQRRPDPSLRLARSHPALPSLSLPLKGHLKPPSAVPERPVTAAASGGP